MLSIQGLSGFAEWDWIVIRVNLFLVLINLQKAVHSVCLLLCNLISYDLLLLVILHISECQSGWISLPQSQPPCVLSSRSLTLSAFFFSALRFYLSRSLFLSVSLCFSRSISSRLSHACFCPPSVALTCQQAIRMQSPPHLCLPFTFTLHQQNNLHLFAQCNIETICMY